MKALVVSNLYPPYARGGSEKVAAMTVDGFRALGYEVSVLTAMPFNGFQSLRPKLSVENGIRIYRWYPLNLYFYANAANYPRPYRYLWTLIDVLNIAALLSVRSVIKKENPDFIVSHNLKGLGYLLPRLFAWQKTYIHVLHDTQLAEPSGLVDSRDGGAVVAKPMNRFYQVFTRWCFKQAPIVVSPSKFLMKFYRDLEFFSKSKTAIIRNPMREVLFKKTPHSGINVLFIGQLEPHKGVAYLLSAWQKIKVAEAKLYIVGNGTLYTPLYNALSDDSTVELMGFNETDAERIWSITDVLAFPSLCCENAPMAVVEALYRAIPVVASNVGGVKELLKDSSQSRLVPPGGPDMFAFALRGAMEEIKNGMKPLSISPQNPIEYVQSLINLTRP